MLVVTEKIKDILDKKGITQYRLSKLIDYNPSAIANRLRGERPFPDDVIEKMAPVLEVSVDEIKGWIIADKYSKEVIELAIQAKKEKQYDNLISTTKIDELLQSKNLSRTALSKLITYSQGWLNEMIIGHEPISRSVMARMSKTLEISEDQIKGWIMADKYSIESLEVALQILQ